MATAGLLARPAPAPSRFRSDINAGPLVRDNGHTATGIAPDSDRIPY